MRPASVRRLLALCWGLPEGNRTAAAIAVDDGPVEVPTRPMVDQITPRIEARNLVTLLGR